MAAMNSSVLSCNYSIAGTGASELNAKLVSMPSVVSPVIPSHKWPLIRAQQAEVSDSKGSDGRRAAMLCLAATLFTTAAAASANAGIIEEYLEKSKANKELNDKKRLATSGANFARAFTVQFGSCKFPENFTGCQDLAKQKKVPFITEDLQLECEGKDKKNLERERERERQMADCVGKSKRVLEESSSTSFTKKRKIDSDIEEFELVNNVVDVHESHSLVTNSPATSSNSGDLCCSGIVPSDIVKDSSTLVDLEGERFETENPTCINNNNISRDITTTPSEICRESSKDMDYQEKKPSTERNHRRDSRAKKSPSQAELDEFFAVAEEQEQKRFIEKYNYDIVKDTPLEGRYQWVRI